jgi:cell division GTPase FtsZ
MSIVRIGVFTNRYSKRKKVMSVKNETVVGESEQIVDDISNEESNEEVVDQDVMAQLKAKMAAKKAESVVEEKKDMTVKIIEKKKRSIDLGIVASGQAGGRIAETFNGLGYPVVAINTAEQDLSFLNIDPSAKLHLQWTLGGTARDRSVSTDATDANIDSIRQLVADKLDSSVHGYIFAHSLAGGSGSGSAKSIISMMQEFGKPIIVIAILPLSNDDAVGMNNTITALSQLTEMAQNKQIANLILVDNSRIETIFADVSQMDFFSVSNMAIVDGLDAFNKYSAQPSKIKSFDPQEFGTVLFSSNGLSTYGSLDINDVQEPTKIAEAVIESLSGGLLASGFDLKQASHVGVLFVGDEKTMKSIPSANINYAMSIIKETSPSATIFRGLYEDESIKPGILRVYSIFGGMGLPVERVNSIKKSAKELLEKSKGRDQDRNLTLKLDTGVEETVSAADKVRDMIKRNGSTFNKNFTGIKDFRKK